MIKELKICNKPVHELKQLLFKNGFKTYNGTIFTYQQDVGNELILLKIIIDLENKEVDYSVINKIDLCEYIPFYYNVNGESNEFAVKVSRDVCEIINKFTKAGIFRK